MKNVCRIYVGTYSQPILFGTGEVLQGKGVGIYLYDFDMETGNLYERMPPKAAVNPSYLTISPNQKYLYAVNELKEFNGICGGAVSAYRIGENGELSLLDQKPTGGADPCHINMDKNGKYLLVANFMSGSICSYPVSEDGSLSEKRQLIQHEGHSVHPVRQKGPHAHAVVLAPDEKYIVVPDLGLDHLMIYPVDFGSGEICREKARGFFVGGGMGPRCCVFNQKGDRCYVFCEIASKILTLAYRDGEFQLMQTSSSLVEPCHAENIGADIHLSSDDNFLYVSNRGQNSIVVFAVQMDGTLQYVQTMSCEGKTPRNFTIDPSGRWLLVGNQDSDAIVVFTRDHKTGTLTFKNKVDVPTPVCIYAIADASHA